MPRLPTISGQDCIRAMAKLGYMVDRSRGSHVILHCPGRRPLVVPLHRELKRGTLRSLIRDAELTVEEFGELP